MRQKCIKKRSKRPDPLFVQMILEYQYPWLIEPENLDRDFLKSQADTGDDIDFDADFDEDDFDFEDEIIESTKKAGFYIDEDGECQFLDDCDDDEDVAFDDYSGEEY